MPSTTPVYKFPVPLPGETPDMPAQVAALNARAEREWCVWRGNNEYEREASWPMTLLPNYTLMASDDTPLGVIGWAQIDCELGIIALAPNQYVGGSWQIRANGVALITGRWHNYIAAPGAERNTNQLIRTNLAASVVVPASMTSLNTQIWVGADATSGGANHIFGRTIVRQFGAPATG